VLGEYGIDSLRNGEEEQAALLGMHLEEVFGNGLAGTCCFAYTDDWFTGGHPITDWAFGLVRRDRSLKPAFHAVAKVFGPQDPLPALPAHAQGLRSSSAPTTAAARSTAASRRSRR
jgi:hypothetical protein